MDTKKYQTNIEIDIVPSYHNTVPEIVSGVDHAVDRTQLSQPTTLKFNQLLTAGLHSVIIDFVNKQDADCLPHLGLDKYITIGAVKINGIYLPRFNWMATYEPVFPEPWYSQQNPSPNRILIGATHLGWNGRWQLQFSAPVFTWIHQMERMGWIWPT